MSRLITRPVTGVLALKVAHEIADADWEGEAPRLAAADRRRKSILLEELVLNFVIG